MLKFNGLQYDEFAVCPRCGYILPFRNGDVIFGDSKFSLREYAHVYEPCRRTSRKIQIVVVSVAEIIDSSWHVDDQRLMMSAIISRSRAQALA